MPVRRHDMPLWKAVDFDVHVRKRVSLPGDFKYNAMVIVDVWSTSTIFFFSFFLVMLHSMKPVIGTYMHHMIFLIVF